MLNFTARIMIKIFCLVLCLISMVQIGNSQILKVQLSSQNDCNGELQIGIYVRASQYSPLDFRIGSSSFFLDYDPSIVSYLNYIPEEFNEVGSYFGSWIDQKETADDECGLFNVVLQLQENDGPNLFLTKQNLIHIGTVYFDILLENTDPNITLNQRFTQFNKAETNDGTQEVSIEDYPKIFEYSCLANCGEAPIVDNMALAAATCLNNNGSISLSFPDNAGRTNIEFSTDGGFTYPFNTPDNVGTYVIDDLGSGIYDLWVRWGDDACPTDIDDALIINDNGPTSAFVAVKSCGTNDSGMITFTFPDHPTRTGVEFSIDGGFSFPYFSADDVGSFDVTGISAGNYNVWMRWGDDSCPTSLGFVSVSAEDFPMLSMRDFDICGLQSDGIIEFTFDDHPQYANMEISIDGGVSFPYTVNDLEGSYRVEGLATGTYSIWARWKYYECQNFIGNIVIGNDDPPVVTMESFESCYGNTEGEITFFYDDHPGRSHIEFSIDNGENYTITEDNTSSFTFTDLAPGSYNTWVRWGNDECPIRIGFYEVPLDAGPEVTVISKEDACIGENNGSITFLVINEPNHSTFELSLDDGYSFPFQYPDYIGFVTIENLSAASYKIWVRRSNNICERYLTVSTVHAVECATCTDGILNGTEEYIDCGGTSCMPCDMCPYSTVTVSEKPMPDNLLLQTSNWIKSDGHVSPNGNVNLKAQNYVELQADFEVKSGGELFINIETCNN